MKKMFKALVPDHYEVLDKLTAVGLWIIFGAPYLFQLRVLLWEILDVDSFAFQKV